MKGLPVEPTLSLFAQEQFHMCRLQGYNWGTQCTVVNRDFEVAFLLQQCYESRRYDRIVVRNEYAYSAVLGHYRFHS